MSHKAIFAAIACTIIAVGGCSIIANSNAPKSGQSNTTQVSQNTFVSKDGTVKISAPSSWENTLKEENSGKYNLKLAERAKDLYLMVSSREKVPGIKLDKIAEIGATGAKGAMENPKMERTKLTKVGAFPAVEYKLEGKAAGANIVMLVTSVETPNHFHMVMIGGAPNSFTENQKTLQQIVQSFKEVKKTASAQ